MTKPVRAAPPRAPVCAHFFALLAAACLTLIAASPASAQDERDIRFDDPLLRIAAADAPDEVPAHWTLSSGELPAGACSNGTVTGSGLCRAGGRIAPPDDAVFAFAAQAGVEAEAAAQAAPVAPVAPARPGARTAAGQVPAGVASVPEPQRYALLFGGLGLLGTLARRSGRQRRRT